MAISIKPTVIYNSAQCRKCNDILVSRNSGAVIYCTCKSIGVGGGTRYIKRVGDADNIIEYACWSHGSGIPEPLPLRMDAIQALIAELISTITGKHINQETHYHTMAEACVKCKKCGRCMTELAKMGDDTRVCTACVTKGGIRIL